MLVSGVRSSCEASATNSRWRRRADSRSERAASSESSICSQRPRQLADLVVGAGLGHVARGVAGLGDLTCGRGQRGDRPHRAAGDRHPGEAGEHGRADHPGRDQQPEPADGRVDVLLVAPVLDVARDAAGLAAAQGDGDDAHLADFAHPGDRRTELGRVEDWRRAVDRRSCISRTEASLGLAKSARSGSLVIRVLVIVSTICTCEASARHGALHLAVEVVAHSLRGEVADDHAEEHQDRQRQPGRDRGQPPADGPVPKWRSQAPPDGVLGRPPQVTH